MRNKRIDSFFKKRTIEPSDEPQVVESSTVFHESHTLEDNHKTSESPSVVGSSPERRPNKSLRIETKEHEFNFDSLERDPGLRISILDFPPQERDAVRRTYLKLGPYQPTPPKSSFYVDKNGRRFLPSWYKLFPDWLEFSLAKNGAFCLPCYLFTPPSAKVGQNAFTVEGFRSWKKVNDGNNCAFLNHMGTDPNSLHKRALKCCHDLMNSLQHIDKVVEKQSSKKVEGNRLKVSVSISSARLCAYQGIALRGHDESPDSLNRGNFIEIIKHTASFNKDVDAVVLKNAPKNATYTSPDIQKQILSLLASKVQQFVVNEIDDGKFCLLVDESQDISKREQMAIVLRFVDKEGFIRERFFDVVHVLDTKALTLKKEIHRVLSQHNLNIHNLRGQGYDGASNMRGEFNGLQALFLEECPYAYYVHCFAHRLQLALVTTSRQVIPVSQFFDYLSLIVNLVTYSSKRVDKLRSSKAARIAEMIENGEIETGRGQNQIRTLKRAGSTRWSSHFSSVSSLIVMFDDTCSVLADIINDGSTIANKSEADGVYDIMTSFEFVFILHLMRDIMGYTDILCQALQFKSQDILNAMDLVTVTKAQLQQYREDGWDGLLNKVKSFCIAKNIDIPDMNSLYKKGRGRNRKENDPITLLHHYRIDMFLVVVDFQIQEISNRFKEDVMELLILSSSLDPREDYKAFDVQKICQLAHKFYPNDFTDLEKLHLEDQLKLYKIEVHRNSQFQNLSTLPQVCQILAQTGKSMSYNLVDRLVRLVLILPVSTATTERAFSAMNLIKTKLRSTMGDDFLSSNMIVHIEKEIVETFSMDSLIDEFEEMRTRRDQLKMPRPSLHPRT